jgi:Rhomboid family
MNMFALYAMGPVLERMWGPARFLGLYIVSGLGGSGLAMVLSPASGLVGASGALCGILASMAAWVLLNRPYLPATLASDWMRRIMSNVILIVLISVMPGVSAAGHFGGAAAGLIAAVPLTYSRFGLGVQRWLGLLGFLAVPVVTLLLTYQGVMPATEAGRAHARYWPQLLEAEHVSTQAWEKVLRPLQDKANRGEPITAQEVENTFQAVAHAQGVLSEVGGNLERAPAYDDKRVNQALEFARAYVQAWQELFACVPQVLDAQGNWNRREADRLPLLVRRKDREVQHLNDSVLASGGQ